MSETLNIPICNRQQGHQIAKGPVLAFIDQNCQAGRRYRLSIKPETRSLAQNARMWAMLEDISAQVDWHGRKLTSEEWKHVFTAALKRQDVVPGLDGGFVVLGQSTSAMTIREMGELQTLMEAFGAQQGVRFSAPEWAEDGR